MKDPLIPVQSTSRDVTDVFLGYNHALKIAENEFFNTKNLTTDHYPMLSPRKKRGEVMSVTDPGGLLEKDALAEVHNGTLYYNFQATPITGLSTGEKQLVSMGAYIVIFPDKKYYNTEDPTDYGDMEAHYTYTGTVKYTMCHVDGTPYESVYKGDTEPSSTAGYEIWIQTASGTTKTLIYSYSYSEKAWVELNTVYTKIEFGTNGQLPQIISEYDGVSVSGAAYDDINGSKILYGVGGDDTNSDYIVVVYQMSDQTQTFENQTFVIDRNVPTMDFVCESQNRLWGCYYGYDSASGKTLNELYCCVLGDFKNWNRFLGISTDAWVGSVGSDGEWTGAVNLLGTPIFFKENHLHLISVSSTGAHQISETPCRGVQKGSHRSLRIVNEVLYYKSRTDICAYQGSFPEGVSDALGDEKYYQAVAGSFGEKYYVSMLDSNSNSHLFTYDIEKGIWIHEDDLRVLHFAKVDDELYGMTANKLIALNGTTGTLENKVSWIAESGVKYYEYADNKYVSRYNFRLKGTAGSKIDVYIEYDSDGIWHHNGTVRMNGINTVTLPIRPRRCDHLRLKLVGEGDVKIYSVARIIEVGSDV